MIALLLGMADAPALAIPRTVFADARVLAPDARLVWPDNTRLGIQDRDGEVVIRFDRPVSSEAIAGFREAAGDAIADLRWNDNSLVLRPSAGWTMSWRQAGSELAFAFVPAAPDQTAADGAGDGAPDTELAAIEAAVAAGYPGQALRAATRLAERYPGDRRVARLLADVRMADGDVRTAARDYRALAADDPAARRAIAAAPGTASVGIVARDGSDLSQIEYAARVDAAIDDRFAVGGGLRHISSGIATTGRDVRKGDTVVDASLSAVFDHAIRVQVIASSALDGGGTGGVAGGGAKFVAGSADAQLRGTLTRHMPDYSTPAQVLGGGYLSRALLGVTYRLTPGVVAQADIGANRYGIGGGDGASDTLVANAGADYLVRRQFPALGLTYRFEAEYVRRMMLGADGAAIVPLASRENHTVQGLLSGAIGAVQLTALAGWTVDRFGGDGPTASIGIAAPIAVAWRVEGGAGITSITRPGFSGRQVFARAQLTRSLGDTQ